MTQSVISPELQAKLAIWRQKATAGTLSIEDTREAVRHLRSDRNSAAYEPSGKKRTAKSADDMLGELGL